MTDPIDSVRRTGYLSSTEKISATKRTGPVKRDHEKDDFTFEDNLDVAPEAHLSNAPDVIDISLEMIEALVRNELPEEAITALQSFAPIGEMTDATAQCERIRQKGQDFISWEKNKTLGEALAYAAS